VDSMVTCYCDCYYYWTSSKWSCWMRRVLWESREIEGDEKPAKKEGGGSCT